MEAYDIHTPLEYNIFLDVIYSSSSEVPWNRIGYASRILLSNSQVASLGLRCFHCTFTCPMVQFRRVISLLSRIQSGSTRIYPSGSTCTTFQSITWVASWTYFFKTEVEKHYVLLSWVVMLADMQLDQFYIKFQTDHSNVVLTLHNSPVLEIFSLALPL